MIQTFNIKLRIVRNFIQSHICGQFVIEVSLKFDNGCHQFQLSKLTIRSVGLLDAPVVGDVLPLRVDSVERDVDLLCCVVAVLPDDTLSLLQETFHRLRLPPVSQIAWNFFFFLMFIKRSVKPFEYFLVY